MLTPKLRSSKTELQHKQCEKNSPADHRARKRDAKRNTSVNDSPINFLPGTPAPNQPGALNGKPYLKQNYYVFVKVLSMRLETQYMSFSIIDCRSVKDEKRKKQKKNQLWKDIHSYMPI